MGNENQQALSPEKEEAPPKAVEKDPMQSELETLIKELNGMSILKTRKSLVAVGGMFLIIIALAIFISNIIFFVQNYDIASLGQEAQVQLTSLSQGKDVDNLVNELKTTFIPALRDHVMKKFEADLPKFKEQGMNVANNLKLYLENDVKEKLMMELGKSLGTIEEELLKKHPNISTEKMEEVLKEAQVEFVEQLTSTLEEKLDSALKDLNSLNSSFEKLKETAEYKKLKKEDTNKIEDDLIEAMLELAIYNFNPARGSEAVEGGAK